MPRGIVGQLNDEQKRRRMNLRNFYLVATIAELNTEKERAEAEGDWLKSAVMDELIEEEDY